MMRRLNIYFAILAITIVGGGASLMIIHVAKTTTFGYYTESGFSVQGVSVNKIGK